MDVYSCAGSNIILAPTPGVDDFPQIISGIYYIEFQQFKILNETFNDTRWWQTFTLPIYVDDVPEGVEEFNLTLSLVPDPTLPPRAVNVTPAVATVRIRDFSCKVLCFIVVVLQYWCTENLSRRCNKLEF